MQRCTAPCFGLQGTQGEGGKPKWGRTREAVVRWWWGYVPAAAGSSLSTARREKRESLTSNQLFARCGGRSGDRACLRPCHAHPRPTPPQNHEPAAKASCPRAGPKVSKPTQLFGKEKRKGKFVIFSLVVFTPTWCQLQVPDPWGSLELEVPQVGHDQRVHRSWAGRGAQLQLHATRVDLQHSTAWLSTAGSQGICLTGQSREVGNVTN